MLRIGSGLIDCLSFLGHQSEEVMVFVAVLFPCQALKKLKLLKQVEYWVFLTLVTGSEEEEDQRRLAADFYDGCKGRSSSHLNCK